MEWVEQSLVVVDIGSSAICYLSSVRTYRYAYIPLWAGFIG